MKMTKAFVLGGMALVAVAMASQDTVVTLRRKLVENTTDTYKVESKVKQTITMPNGLGEQEVSISSLMTYAIKTLKVDATSSSADIESKTKIDTIEMEGPGPGAMPDQKDKETILKGKMDELGVISVDAPTAASSMAMLMGSSQSGAQAGMFVSFPKNAVKIGDTWNIVVPKGLFTGSEDQILTAKLIGDKQVDGKDLWVVSVIGTVKTKFDTSKLPKDPKGGGSEVGAMKMVIKGTTEIAGEGLVDKSNGKTVSMVSKSKTKTNIDMTDMGMNLDTTGTVTTTVTLQK